MATKNQQPKNEVVNAILDSTLAADDLVNQAVEGAIAFLSSDLDALVKLAAKPNVTKQDLERKVEDLKLNRTLAFLFLLIRRAGRALSEKNLERFAAVKGKLKSPRMVPVTSQHLGDRRLEVMRLGKPTT